MRVQLVRPLCCSVFSGVLDKRCFVSLSLRGRDLHRTFDSYNSARPRVGRGRSANRFASFSLLNFGAVKLQRLSLIFLGRGASLCWAKASLLGGGFTTP